MMRALSSSQARDRLGIHPSAFKRLAAAGVFHRDPYGLFKPETLAENLARAVEIERRAEAQIATIRRATARRLAALGAPPQIERKLP